MGLLYQAPRQRVAQSLLRLGAFWAMSAVLGLCYLLAVLKHPLIPVRVRNVAADVIGYGVLPWHVMLTGVFLGVLGLTLLVPRLDRGWVAQGKTWLREVARGHFILLSGLIAGGGMAMPMVGMPLLQGMGVAIFGTVGYILAVEVAMKDLEALDRQRKPLRPSVSGYVVAGLFLTAGAFFWMAANSPLPR